MSARGLPALQGLGTMEEENAPRARPRVGVVAKQEFAAGRGVFESGLPFAPNQVAGHIGDVTGGRIGEAGQRGAGQLRRDHAAQLARDEESIVDRPGGG
jgi:hypothetical protein